MKKLLLISIISLFSTLLAGQNVGKWVLPLVEDAYTHNDQTVELVFNNSNNPLTHNTLPEARPYSTLGVYGGAYSVNFADRSAYLLGQKFYYTDNQNTTQVVNWVDPLTTYDHKNFQPSFRILPLDASGNEQLIIYILSASYLNDSYLYTTNASRDPISGEWSFSNIMNHISNFINPWYGQQTCYLFSSFTIVSNGTGYKLIACTNAPMGTYPRLCSFDIDENGIVPGSMEVILSPEPPFSAFDIYAYSAWQLTKSTDAQNNNLYAWCSSSGWNNTDPDRRSNLYVSVNSTATMFNLGLGPITGVAFSDFEPGYVYVSCKGTNSSNRGIYKVNYSTGQASKFTGSDNYNHTWLKKAPDGNIYAVKNDGTKLARINQTNGNFENDYYTFPLINNYTSRYAGYYDIEKNSEVSRLYYLPDDNRPIYNLAGTVGTTYTQHCVNYGTGTATALVSGGTPQYSFKWYKVINGQLVLIEGQTQATISGLAAGNYACIVTDAIGYTIQLDFTITFDPDEVELEFVELEGVYYNVTKVFEKGFSVAKEKTLRLIGCNFQFMENAKVVIQNGEVNGTSITYSGGTMILDGTTFTRCGNNYWQGIEVWGKVGFLQILDQGKLAQGRLYMNNSLIEYARCAVDLGNPADNTSNGGMVMAENSIFRNNKKSVHAAKYIFTVGGTSYDNRSYLKNCTFQIVPGYLYLNPQTDQFFKHVDLYEVKGFKFEGCNFSVDNVPGVSIWNHGIAAYNAGLKVVPGCTSNPGACRSTFTGFSRGITILGSLSNTYGLYVNMADFINVGTGIYLHSLPNATVIQSSFHLKPNIADDSMCISGNPYAWGIMARYSKFLTFEENTISRSVSYAHNFNRAGIGIVNCKTDDIIYKNTFNNLSIGNYSYGPNRSDQGDDDKGITYQCNLNSNNIYSDFIVTGETDTKGFIRGTIGSDLLAAGNTFTSNASWNFRNEGTQDINYYHYGMTYQYPRRVFTLKPNKYFFRINVSTDNTCPSKYNGGGGIPIIGETDRLLLEQQHQAHVDSYTSLQAYYEGLIDGGSTEFTLSEIIAALPEQAWDLISSLLAKSPYLSTAALIEAANRQDVIPQSMLFEILAANPEELRNDTLMNHLETMTNPLPVYMMDVLRSIASGNSARSALLSEMDDYSLKISGTVKTLLNTMLLDTVTDNAYIRYWLAKKGDIQSAKLIAASYFSENQPDSAFAILSEIPYFHAMDSEALTDYENLLDLTELLVQIKSQNIPFDSIDSTQYQYLTELSANGGEAGAMARSFMEYAFGQRDCHCVADTGSVPLKKTGRLTIPKTTIVNTIRANPNPATQWVEFEYTLGGNTTKANIQITDEAGRRIRTISVAGNKGKVAWDTRGIAPGIYFANLIANGHTATIKIIKR